MLLIVENLSYRLAARLAGDVKSFFLVFICLLLSSKGIAADIYPAKPIASYWLNNSLEVGLSGLSYCDELISVSPKNNKIIYKIYLGDQHAKLDPYINVHGLTAPKKGRPKRVSHFVMDLFRPKSAMRFGGVSCRHDGSFVLSERYHKIAHVDKDGSAAWLHDKWSSVIGHLGYTLKYNNGGEGIVDVGDDLWVAMEREPRGLLKIRADKEFQVFSLPEVEGLDFNGHPEDIRGLDYHDGALFTLESNASAVCRRALPSLQAEWCLVYREIEESPEYAYEASGRGGMGAGVAVNNKGIFVIFNNSNISRASKPADRRGLLLHLAFPEGAH
ncbi:hypothetical protein [Microbulbifer sp. PSTR4-B]|uniref:hypothetical protein n=1 Tax=Microbulbifer sp. PSTR4-B TaxID=3243396 RepID=UPI0040394A6B